MLSISNHSALDIGDRILDGRGELRAGFRRRPGDAGRDRAPRGRQQADGLPPLARHRSRSLAALLTAADHRRAARRAVSRATGPRSACASGSSRSPNGCGTTTSSCRCCTRAPELAMVYITERLGTSQQILHRRARRRARGRAATTAACGRRTRVKLAAMCLLITQSTIQSAQIVEPILDADALGVRTRPLTERIPACHDRFDRTQRRPPRAPTWPRWPTASASTSSSSAAASPAPASRWTPRPAGCRWRWWRSTIWRSAPAGGAPSWCTAGCATWRPATSASPGAAPSSAES